MSVLWKTAAGFAALMALLSLLGLATGQFTAAAGDLVLALLFAGIAAGAFLYRRAALRRRAVRHPRTPDVPDRRK